jgi:peptide/nickel transport system ATP-binding protein
MTDRLDCVRSDQGAESPTPLLSLRDLRVEFETETGPVEVVHGVSLDLMPGETLGLVGESGSGKSITALSVLGLLPIGGRVTSGTLSWNGRPLSADEHVRLRGRHVTLINQEPMSTLDPLVSVGRQVREVLRKHKHLDRRAAHARARELFDLVGIPDAERRLKQYPWEFSGGMAQRVVIALALAPEPSLLIADEPTTALDVTIQAQILRVITDIQEELDLAMLIITHDLGVVAGVADRLSVMYAGRVVENGTTSELFRSPEHPYTIGLLQATPNPNHRLERLVAIPGNPPSAGSVAGCAFAPRCGRTTSQCSEQPSLIVTHDRPTRKVACWHVD